MANNRTADRAGIVSTFATVAIAAVALIIGYAVPAEAGPVVLNAGFEADIYLNGGGGTAQQNGGTITNWTIGGGAADVGLNPFWTNNSQTTIAGTPHADNGVVPEGVQVAFLRNSASLSQLVTGFEPGTQYRLRYSENDRAYNPSGSLEVTLDGQVIVADHATTNVEAAGSFTQPYHSVVSDAFVATADAHTLSFVSTSGLDRSVLIDDVQIEPLANARIAHWKLDETSGQTANDSAGSYHGQLGNSASVDSADPVVNQPGHFGTAYRFNSAENDRVDLSSHIANFSSLDSGTITGWFNTATADRGALLNYGESNSTDRMLLEMQGGNLRFLIREAPDNITFLQTTETFNDGQWHHFAVTNDGITTSLLVDGEVVPLNGGTTDSASWFDDLAGADSLTLGYEIRVNAELPFDGLLDDFAIFDYALTSEQLDNVMNYGAEYFLVPPTAVPEPSTFALAALGLIGMAWFGWRRKK